MSNPQQESRELTALLEQQRDVYRHLCELAAGQSAAVSMDEPESLLRILGQRQQLIGQLNEVNRCLEPYRSRWDELREQLSPAQRVRVGALVEEVQSLLGQILQQDERDSSALRQRTQQTRHEASTVQIGQRLNAAYAAQSYGRQGPRFLDRRDEEGAR